MSFVRRKVPFKIIETFAQTEIHPKLCIKHVMANINLYGKTVQYVRSNVI